MNDLYDLKFHRSYVHIPHIIFLNPSMRKECHFSKMIFVTEFVIFCKNSPFYELVLILPQRLCEWRNFKNNFSRSLFTIIFRPKIVILDTYSILSRYTKYKSVAYYVKRKRPLLLSFNGLF